MATVVFGSRVLHDRDEQEVRGYRDALRLVHERSDRLEITEKTIRDLHALTRARKGDAGEYKTRDSDIIERLPSGDSRVRFRTVPAAATTAAIGELVAEWKHWESGCWLALVVVAAAAFNLDFLCSHPFRDGNGRTSRLLPLLQCHRIGYDVDRYISIERLIDAHKDRYYETLQSSVGWHERRHDPWPYINFVLFIIKAAYREFEQRVGDTRSPRGSKTARVMTAIGQMSRAFAVADLQHACPGVGIDLIRKILKGMRSIV